MASIQSSITAHRKLRVLFVVEHFPAFSETFVLGQVTGLLDLGHHVEVYAIGKPVTPVMHPDFEKYRLHERAWRKPEVPASKWRRACTALKFLPRCFRHFPRAVFGSLNVFRHGHSAANLSLFYSLLPFLEHRSDFDVVHCHFGDKGLLALRWQQWGVFRQPLSVVFHAHEIATLSDSQGRATYRELLASEALLLPISQLWRELLLRWGGKSDFVRVQHMGVDCSAIAFRARTVTVGQTIQLLSVSRLTEMKGHEFAIRAVALLSPKFPTLRYTIVGTGPLWEPLQKLTADLMLTEVIRFVGAQPQDKVRGYLDQAHIFLCPSVTDSHGCREGIPVALMESLAAGLPTVATRHSGIPELVADQNSGLLVAERDAAGLAVAVERLISDVTLYTSVAQVGRATVERDFNLWSLNQSLADLLREKVEQAAVTAQS